MDEKRAGHSPAENAAHSRLGSSHSRRDRSKEELEVGSVVSLVESFFTRVERVFDVHDLDVSMHSQIIQGIQRPEGLRFLVAGALSSSNSVGAGDDSLDVL